MRRELKILALRSIRTSVSPCSNSSCLVYDGESWEDTATPVTRGSWGHEHTKRKALFGEPRQSVLHVDPLTASSSAVCPKEWCGPPPSSPPDSATNILWLLRRVIVCRISQTFSVWLFAHVFTARLTFYFHLVLFY